MNKHLQPGLTGNPLFQGAAILGTAAIISKVIGTFQKIPLQNLAGDEIFGLFNSIYPLYVLILTITTAGIPLAVSKLVAERSALGQWQEADRLMRMASLLVIMTGIGLAVLLYASAGLLADWMNIRQAEQGIRAVSLALLFAPLMAVLRGYFQGLQDMVPTAVSQVVEQMVRVLTMIVLLVVLMGQGAASAHVAAGAMFGSVTGAAGGLAIMLYYYRVRRRQIQRKGKDKERFSLTNRLPLQPMHVLVWSFIRYAIPVSLGTIVLPVLMLTDAFTIPRQLMARGLSEAAAMTEFGIFNRGLPFVQLVTLISASMSAALVPAIAEAKEKKEAVLLQSQVWLAMRLSWFIGLGASVGLAVVAEPLNIMFYSSSIGTEVMAVVGLTTVFSVMTMVSTAILTGMGHLRAAVIHLLLAAGCKVGLNMMLVPQWGIMGAAWASLIAFALAGICHIVVVNRQFGRMKGQRLLLAASSCVAVVIMVLFIKMALWCWAALSQLDMMHGFLSYRLENSVAALLAIMTGALVYSVVLLRFGVFSAKELAAIPGLRRKVLPLLIKMKWIQL